MCISAPPHLYPLCLLKVGMKKWGLRTAPCTYLEPFNRLQSLQGSTQGAPNTWKGLVVPLPSDRLVASRRHMPG